MSRKCLFLLLPVVFWVAGCTPRKAEGKAVARFGGETITEGDFLKKAENMPPELRAAAYRKRREFLNDLIGEKFLLNEAVSRHLDREADVSDLLAQARNKILVSKLIQIEVDRKIKFDDEEARRFYDLHKDDFLTPLMLRASHVLVKTREEAEAIKNALDAGADFEETARQKSIDPTSIRGGDLGFFQKGQFVPEFEEAVFSMKKNEIKGPIQTPFGWHVIKLTDRVEPAQRSFDSVKNRIRERLIQEKRAEAFRQLIERLQGNVKISIDEQALEAIPAPAERSKEV